MGLLKENITELKKLAKKLKNLHGMENLEIIMGVGIGVTVYRILEKIEDL